MYWSKKQTAKILNQIQKLYERGLKQIEIANKLYLSRAYVNRAIKKIKSEKNISEENIEEQYIKDNEKPHDIPPFDEENPETSENLEEAPEDPSDESENDNPETPLKEENDDFSDLLQKSEGSDFISSIASLAKVLETGNTNLIRAIENTKKIESVVKNSVAVATAEFQKTIELASQNLNFATKTIEENAERFKISAENSVNPSETPDEEFPDDEFFSSDEFGNEESEDLQQKERKDPDSLHDTLAFLLPVLKDSNQFSLTVNETRDCWKLSVMNRKD